jgi:hypothetical protein
MVTNSALGARQIVLRISRYPESITILSGREPLEDLMVFLEFLTSRDYIVETLTKVHAVAPNDAKARAGRIIPHVRAARGFLNQCLDAPTDVSFLSGYYALLNLLKVYILFGKHHAELQNQQRWHGANYPVNRKDSRSLLTDEIILQPAGAIALFYKSITGQVISKKTPVSIGDLVPYIYDVAFEYQEATGKSTQLAALQFDVAMYRSQTVPRALVWGPNGARISPQVRQLRVLSGFRRQSGEPNQLLGAVIDVANAEADIRKQLRTFLLYSPIPQEVMTPRSGLSVLLPEELPIALLFFHMSSVVRYKPEFLAKLRDSRCWPILAAARLNCIQKFLTVFWSFVKQQSIVIQRY